MNINRAVLSAANIIEDKVNERLEKSLNQQRSAAPVTTPTIYEINAMIGSGELYNKMEDAAKDRVLLEDGSHPENYEKKIEAQLVDAGNFRAYLSALIYHYLETQHLQNIDTGEMPSVNYKEFVEELRKDNYDWEGKISNQNSRGLSQSTKLPNVNLIWISFLPESDLVEIQSRIQQKLSDSELESELVEVLSEFPYALNRMAGSNINFENKFAKVYYKELSKVLEKIGAEPDVNSFNKTLLHEITHDYLKKKTDRSLDAKTLDEAFAQFTHRVYRDGINFTHSPKSYRNYEEHYPKTGPENIWWMVEIIREKASELDLRNEEYTVIDWARMSEVKIHKKGIESRVEFLEFFTPNKIKKKLSKFNSVVKEELKPVLKDLTDAKEDISKFNPEKIDEDKHQNHKNLSLEINTIWRDWRRFDNDINKVEQIIESPDRVLRRVETEQVEDQGLGNQNLNGISGLTKVIEIKLLNNYQTVEYEEEIINKILKEEIAEIKRIIEDLKRIEEEIEELSKVEEFKDIGIEQKAERIIKDIRELNKIAKDLEKIYEE